MYIFFLVMAISYIFVVFSWMSLFKAASCMSSCQGAGLKYLNGDALSGSSSCLGPDNTPYPS
jgi:hypothetical protein